MIASLWLHQLWIRLFGRPSRKTVPNKPLRRRVRLRLDVLEERLTPSTYIVNDASDTPGSSADVTLPYAISQALNAGGDSTIEFSPSLSGQTITLSQAGSNNTYGPTAFIISNANITIDGYNAPGLVISGNSSLRPFAVTNTGSLTLDYLTLEDGIARGGDGGSSGPDGGGGGGGAGLGGAVYNSGGNLTAEGVTFENNSAVGGIGGAGNANDNSDTGGGGGGMDGEQGQSGPDGGDGEGGGGSGVSPPQTGDPGGFGGGGGGSGGGPGGTGGFGGGGGGGAWNAGFGGGGSLGGSGGFGGGSGGKGGNDGGGGGGGAGLGGALFSNDGFVTLTNDTFTANTASGGSGGSGSNSGNSGRGNGGAAFLLNGNLTANFDTFSSNSADQGTDVYVLSYGSGNQATASLVNDILGQSNNSLSDFVSYAYAGGTDPNLSGSEYDMVRNNDGLPSSALVKDGSNDPDLSPVADNGGPTATMAISSSSPAFLAGYRVQGITTDQRRWLLPTASEQVSLGAFDPQATAPVPAIQASDATTTFSNNNQEVTLTADVTSTLGTVGQGAVSFTLTKGGSEPLTTPVFGNVINGVASVSYVVPANTPAGTYTIDAVYNPSREYAEFGPTYDINHFLTIRSATVTPTYVVTDASDTAGSATDVTLRYAINQALSTGSPSVIEFSPSLAGKTITVTQAPSVYPFGATAFIISNANITIDGSNAPGLIISGGNAFRAFAVTATGSLTLEDLTVAHGLASGGAGGNGGPVDLTRTGVPGGGGGGAGLGGGVFNNGGVLTVEGVTFRDNLAEGGSGGSGGVGMFIGPWVGSGGGGGGIGIDGQSNVDGSGGGGTGGSGGLYNGSDGGIGGGGGGGGVFGTGNGGAGGFGGGGGGGGVNFVNTGHGGSGGFGGGGGGQGIPFKGGYGSSGLAPAGVSVGGAGGGGGGMGGALFSNAGSLTLINDTFTSNNATGGEAGPNEKSLFTGRNASNGSGDGGAVFVVNGDLTATFDTFSGNTADQGADLYVLSYGSGNQANAAFINDILASGGSDFVSYQDDNGIAPNLNASASDLVMGNDGLPATAVKSTKNPDLSSLANNGGPTQTMAIDSNSSASEQAVPVTGVSTDQRGYTRPTGIPPSPPPSLGAFDPNATPPPSTTTNASNVTVSFSPSAQSLTLSATVSNPAGAASEGVVTFIVRQGSSVIGSATSSTAFNNGQVSVDYLLPGGLAAGRYSIEADYFDPQGHLAASSSTASLVVQAAATTSGGSSSAGVGPTSSDFALLAVDEFELTLESVLALIENTMQITDPSLDAAIAQLSAAIANNPLFSTFEGHLVLLLGDSFALHVLSGI